MVAWDKVCLPKKFGGLNVKGCKNWNEASVGKLLWQVSEKQDILWVKMGTWSVYKATKKYQESHSY